MNSPGLPGVWQYPRSTGWASEAIEVFVREFLMTFPSVKWLQIEDRTLGGQMLKHRKHLKRTFRPDVKIKVR